ncbi:MAG TPA: diaminopimelate epimerase, partial [Bacteroidales bacterium]|nr:diaminopimelate epimerase [Bacteroidales bacterium]
SFEKYHGAGNDFIMINGIDFKMTLSPDQIQKLCDRHFGIGADGLIIINPSANTDFVMKYYNADGYEGSMCGNGGRCAARFAYERNIADKQMAFSAYDGTHAAEIIAGEVLLEMQDIGHIQKENEDYFIDSGSPHFITFVKNLDSYDVSGKGKAIRHNYRKEGTNVNFLEEHDGKFHIRTFERGVESETLACGTGITAAAVAIAEKYHPNGKEFEIEAKGGVLKVYLEKSAKGYRNIWLKGPAEKVFEGSINI